MPKICADKVIMFCVIGLVGWAIIVFPVILRLVQVLEQAIPNNYAQPTQSEQQWRVGQQNAQSSPNALSKPQAEKDEASAKQHGNWYNTFVDHPAEWVNAIFTVM